MTTLDQWLDAPLLRRPFPTSSAVRMWMQLLTCEASTWSQAFASVPSTQAAAALCVQGYTPAHAASVTSLPPLVVAGVQASARPPALSTQRDVLWMLTMLSRLRSLTLVLSVVFAAGGTFAVVLGHWVAALVAVLAVAALGVGVALLTSRVRQGSVLLPLLSASSSASALDTFTAALVVDPSLAVVCDRLRDGDAVPEAVSSLPWLTAWLPHGGVPASVLPEGTASLMRTLTTWMWVTPLTVGVCSAAFFTAW